VEQHSQKQQYEGFRKGESVPGFGILPSKTAVAQAAMELGHRTICVQEMVGWTCSCTWYRMMYVRDAGRKVPKKLREAWWAARTAYWRDYTNEEFRAKCEAASKAMDDWRRTQEATTPPRYRRVKQFKDRSKEEQENALDLAEAFMQKLCTCTLRGIERQTHWMKPDEKKRYLDYQYNEKIKQEVGSYILALNEAEGMDYMVAYNSMQNVMNNLIENNLLHQFNYYVVQGKE
jgi:hypothetical protein